MDTSAWAMGRISLDILSHNWSPALYIRKALLGIRILMDDPNADDTLVPEIATIYKNNRPLFDQTAKEWTRKFAM